MATSDSEDFESADEELEEVTGNLKGTLLPSNKPKTTVKVQTALENKILDSGDNEMRSEIDIIAKSLDNSACLKEIQSQISMENNTCEPLSKCEANKVTCESKMYLQQEHESSVKCDNIKMLNVSIEGSDNISVSKEEQENSKVDEDVLVCEEETDGWDCEDEDIDKQLIEENCNRDNLDTVLNKLSESIEKDESNSSGGGGGSAWSGWGSWGVTSLLSTATESVSTLTNQVSQGLSTVLETGLGVPNPEDLIKQEIEQENKILAVAKEKSEPSVEENEEEENAGIFGFGRVISGVSSITKLVETAGTKVVSGGLDTLESIGKKTMEVLQEGDPGLRKKRALFSEKVVLSQVLREAKEKAEQEDKALKNTEEARKVHFETLFDDYHGLVHLEALEMLSKQCNIKLQSVLLNTPSSDVPELQESISEVKDVCQLPDEDAEGASFETLKSRLSEVGKGLPVPVANDKLVRTWEEVHQWLQDCSSKQRSIVGDREENTKSPAPTACEMHQKAIATLARLTAEAVEQFHKTAELLLVCEKRSPVEEAKILLYMTYVFSLQVSTAATVFSENLNTCSEYASSTDAVNSHITNIFLEAANSSSYIQDAFQLLVPVLQVGIVSS